MFAPAWVKDAIFYQIFPDRFCRSERYHAVGKFVAWGSKPSRENMFGGNLAGIEDKLEYIAGLGVNAIYLCPIFKSNSNHRYHTVDYFEIDPVLGTLEDFDRLVKKAHKLKLRVILDGVFNHCSRGFFQFNSLMELGEHSPYVDWFHVKGWPLNAYTDKPNYECWWNFPALPKFNTDCPDVREYLFSVGEYWMKRGIDGWRLDVPNEIDDDSFWQEFRRRVKKVNPDAYIVGEIWDEPSRWLKGDQFDGVMNDLERSTKTAYSMVAYAGMSDTLPNLCYYNQQEYSFSKPYSDSTAQKIDNEVLAMINGQYRRAKEILDNHRDGHNRLAQLLIEREVIFAQDVEDIFGKRQWTSRSEEILGNDEAKTEDTASPN